MANSYERQVQDAEEIDDLVGEAHKRAEEEGLTRLFLDHEEDPNIVKGRNQPFHHTENEDIIETRRRDGGLAWYHDSTKCFMLSTPGGDGIFHQYQMAAWINTLSQELEELGYSTETRWDKDSYNVDIYNEETGRQLLGLSGSSEESTTVIRACWYEEEPEIEHLLEAEGEDVEEFYNSFETVDGLYSTLKDRFNPENVDYDFVSDEVREKERDYLTREEGQINGSCITGPRAAD